MASHDITERERGARCCADGVTLSLSMAEAQQVSDDLHVLGHPVRLLILDVLAQYAGKVCVCDLEAAVPVKQPTVSHHLRLLREAGLVDAERHGPWMYYFIRHEALEALRSRITRMLALFEG